MVGSAGLGAISLVFVLLGIGFAFARLRVLPENAAEVLNRLVLYLCLPASVLLSLPKLQLESSLIGLALTPWLLMLAAVGLVAVLGRIWRLRRDVFAVLLLCVALGNSGFIGYPMVRELLGEQALPYAVVYDQFGACILLSTVGLYVAARYSGETPPDRRQIVMRLLRFPPLWALLFGVTLMPEQPPAWIAAPLIRLADAMLPLVMLAAGLSLQLRLSADELRPLCAGLLLKLLVMPLLAWPIALAFGHQSVTLQVNVLESAMPTMLTVIALTASHRLAPRLAAALVSYGILLSLATLPVWSWLLMRFGAAT